MENKQLRTFIDELGALQEELAPLKPKIKRAEALRKIVSDAVACGPHEGCKLDGNQYTALVSERENQRFITSMSKLFRILKQRVFLANCSFTLKNVELLVPPEQRGDLIGSAPTGSRTVTTYRLTATQLPTGNRRIPALEKVA